MAAFEGFKVRQFRTDAAGRTVYVPSRFRSAVYLIRDEAEAQRVARFQYNALWWTVAAMAVLVISATWRSSMLLGFFVVALAGRFAQRRLRSSLQRLDERRTDLPPVDHSARSLAYNIALGRRYLWNQLAAGVLLLAMAVAPWFGRAKRSYDGVSTTLLDVPHLFGLAIVLLAAGVIINSIIQLRRIGAHNGRGMPTAV